MGCSCFPTVLWTSAEISSSQVPSLTNSKSSHCFLHLSYHHLKAHYLCWVHLCHGDYEWHRGLSLVSLAEAAQNPGQGVGTQCRVWDEGTHSTALCTHVSHLTALNFQPQHNHFPFSAFLFVSRHHTSKQCGMVRPKFRCFLLLKHVLFG